MLTSDPGRYAGIVRWYSGYDSVITDASFDVEIDVFLYDCFQNFCRSQMFQEFLCSLSRWIGIDGVDLAQSLRAKKN